ncbi:MAG TPA: N-6 DNA methylase, partial [Micromonospora sp.]|nr:N-6 DNA methylase [Micromonospora sp.]
MPKSTAHVTAAEISRLAGVTRATVSNWRRRHADFPTPSGGTEASPAYDLEAVRAWLAARGQLPASSPAEDLRTALRALPGNSTAAIRLLPLVRATDRMDPVDLKTLAELSDTALVQQAQQAARPHVVDIPGLDGLAYHRDEAGLLRALLHCVQEEGAVPALEVLAELDVEETGASGTYRTPAPLTELMADLLTEPGKAFPASVYDPACGTGGLLTAAARWGARELYGQDIVVTNAAQAVVRLGVQAPTAKVRVGAGDSLRADAFPSLAADAALCAPPYGDRDWGHEELAYDPRWMFGLPPKGEPELAWVQHCLAHVAEGAPAVVLMSPATAERAAGRRIRAELARSGALRAVVALPAGAAAPLHVGLHLWLLQRPNPQATPAQHILFVDTVTEEASAGTRSRTKRSNLDWSRIRDTVLNAWHSYVTNPDDFDDVPGTARAVPVIDLLDEAVDLTPARHTRT